MSIERLPSPGKIARLRVSITIASHLGGPPCSLHAN
jgi:hypothetical protein